VLRGLPLPYSPASCVLILLLLLLQLLLTSGWAGS
jgi:hypothetical protein